MYEAIVYTKENGVATILFNRPKVLNALSSKMKHEITEALGVADADPEVRVVLMRGAGGRAFCAGQDLNEGKDVGHSSGGAAAWIAEFDRLYEAMRNLTKPIVAAIEGASVGAGLQIALLADVRIAADNARLGMPEMNVGLCCITGSGLLWNVVGESNTRYLILSGAIVNAQRALQMGAVHEVVPIAEFEAKVKAICEELKNDCPVATKLDKQWLRMLTDDHYQKTVAHAQVAHTEGYASGEPERKMREFLSRKK